MYIKDKIQFLKLTAKVMLLTLEKCQVLAFPILSKEWEKLSGKIIKFSMINQKSECLIYLDRIPILPRAENWLEAGGSGGILELLFKVLGVLISGVPLL